VPQWTADGVALCTAANDQINPTIASDGAGGATVTWQDFRSGTSYDIYAQRVSAAGVPQWTADGVALCTTANDQIHPTITSDGTGGAIVTWWDYRSGTNWDIYAQRVGAAGVPQWNANGVALSSAPNEQDYAAITSDGAGGAIITWDLRAGVYQHVYAQHVTADGATSWPFNGVPMCTAFNNEIYPAIVWDGAGGAIVAWQDASSRTGLAIYAQHVSAGGVPQWTGCGVALCTAAGYGYFPMIASDGAGGAIITWMDGRSGTNYDIYAHRVFGSGGVAAVPPQGDPTNFQMLAPLPNPARDGQLRIRFTLSSFGRVSAQVLDLAGHRVRTLATDRAFSPGTQVLDWDGKNDVGVGLSGMYFVEVRVGAHSEARRAILLR